MADKMDNTVIENEDKSQKSQISPSSERVSLAVFDIDGTVIKGQSPAIMVFSLFKKGLIPVRRAITSGLWGVGYKLGLFQDTVKVREGIFKTFRGMSSDQIDAIIGDVYYENISPRVREKAMEKIRWHQSRGDIVVFISASFEMMTRLMVEETSVHGQSSTKMVVKNGSYTGEIDGKPVEGEEKVKRLRAYADKNFGEGNWKVSYSYADHGTDIPILSMAEHPVAVNPKHKLEVAAQQMGWEIQHW